MNFTKEDLQSLLADALAIESETQEVEFKDGRGKEIQKDLWKAISAFSHNPRGGVIFFGISENNEGKPIVTGGLDLGSLQENVGNYFSDMMENVSVPEMHVLTEQGQKVLAVIVKRVSDEKSLCYYRNKNLPDGAYIRVGNTNRQMSEHEMKEVIRNSTPFKFDRSLVPGTSVNDLSLPKITAFLAASAERTERVSMLPKVGATQAILSNIGVLGQQNGKEYLATLAGYLIFSERNPNEHLDFRRYIVRCVRYAGETTASEILDKADISGTLDVQIEEALSFMLRNIPTEAKIVGAKRVEELLYPREALREIMANAVIHRDYQNFGSYTKVEVFSNRLEVSNPGNLPPGITIKNIKDSQCSRNAVMAQILRDMGLIEEYGRGIDMVYAAMQTRGLLEPTFRNSATSFRVILFGRQFSDLTERQRQAWHYLQEQQSEGKNTITAAVFEKKFGISRAAANKDISQLVSFGLLHREGSGPGTYYEMSY